MQNTAISLPVARELKLARPQHLRPADADATMLACIFASPLPIARYDA